MPDISDSFNEKSKQVDIALKYTGGNIEKAKQMASGQLIDIIVAKTRFNVPELKVSGYFLAFFNYMDEYVANVSSVIVSKLDFYDMIRVFDDWKSLNRDFERYTGLKESIDTSNFNIFLKESFTGYDVFPDVSERNLDELSVTFNEILKKSFSGNIVNSQIEMDTASSLDLEINGIKIDIPGTASESANAVSEQQDDRISQIEREAKFVIEGTAIVSPIKGKNCSDLVPGDRIKVYITGNDIISEKIIKAANAVDDNGNRTPIKGRVKAKIPIEKGGYIIYAFVAKSVLAKIIEEENVKILLDSQEKAAENESRIDMKIIGLMALLVVLIIITGIILFNLL
jgi:hypothetical protein